MRLGFFRGSVDGEIFGWGFSGKGSVRSVVFAEMPEGLDMVADFVDLGGQFDAGVELISPHAVAPFDGSTELERSRRQIIEWDFFAAQAVSNPAMNSDPPSIPKLPSAGLSPL
jgi:hypothetical protein